MFPGALENLPSLGVELVLVGGNSPPVLRDVTAVGFLEVIVGTQAGAIDRDSFDAA
jgi:hypothetical protein